MEGFDIKLEGMFGGQVIPLLSVDGSIQGEVKNWSSAVSRSRESFARNVSYKFSSMFKFLLEFSSPELIRPCFVNFSCQFMQELALLETTLTRMCLNGSLLLSQWKMKNMLIDTGNSILT